MEYDFKQRSNLTYSELHSKDHAGYSEHKDGVPGRMGDGGWVDTGSSTPYATNDLHEWGDL